MTKPTTNTLTKKTTKTFISLGLITVIAACGIYLSFAATSQVSSSCVDYDFSNKAVITSIPLPAVKGWTYDTISDPGFNPLGPNPQISNNSDYCTLSGKRVDSCFGANCGLMERYCANSRRNSRYYIINGKSGYNKLDEVCPFGCSDGSCDPLNYYYLKVAVLKVWKTGLGLEPVNQLMEQINDLISKKPDLDLIVTPEYSLLKNFYFYFNNPLPIVNINCSVTNCTVSNFSNGQSVIDMINQIKSISTVNKINIVLGTLPIHETLTISATSSLDAVYNGLIIINNKGDIIGKKLKSTGSDWCDIFNDARTCNSPEIINAAKSKALASAKKVTLLDRKNNAFSIVTSICADLDEPTASQYTGAKADFLVWSTVNGTDANALSYTQLIQNGTPFEWPAMSIIKSIVLDKFYVAYKAIKEKSYFLVADPSKNGLGIISLTKEKMEEIDISDNYIYGKIKILKSL